MGALDEILAKLEAMPEAARTELVKETMASTKKMKWVPNVGPQTDAYFCKADVLLYGGEPGGGKLLKLDTLIPTPFGWTTMGEVAVGDLVIDESGNPCSVVAKSAVTMEQTYRLTFSDGSEIVAGERHQWVTSNHRERFRAWACTEERKAARRESRPTRGMGKRPDLARRNAESRKSLNLPLASVRTTREIFDTLVVAGGRINHSVAVAGALKLPEANLLIDAYTLGAWLGDGDSSGASIFGADEEIFLQVGNSYPVTRHASQYGHGVLGLKTQLRQLGLLGNKHIPHAYLRASFGQRLALLQGLMDTDGHCDNRGQCEIQLTNKRLIDDTLELIHSLGIKAQMREGTAKLYGRTIGPKWRIKFLTEHPVFRLPRKLIGQKRSGFRGTHDVRYITKCEPVDPVPMQCIQVDSPNHMYLCGKAMIPTHNSQLCLGLAFNEHRRTLIMRRQYGDLDRLVEDAIKIHGSRQGFNGSPPPKLKISENQIIDFAAAHRVGDEQSQMGKGRDLICFDEATHFAESQIRFVMGWLRTDTPGQRTRVILATNPPLSAEGLWVVKMFAPWLDAKYHNPAAPGELRWVVSDDDGNDKWVDGPGEYEVTVAGQVKMVSATSRTYIPASVRDNPFYAATDYERQLDAMPEPYRSLLMGGFQTSFEDKPNQCIPTSWVLEAQRRWTVTPPMDVPMCALGVDASGGGADPMVIAKRYDGWFAPFVEVPGKTIPMETAGAHCAGIVLANRRDNALVVVDMGGGYGGPMYEHLSANEIDVRAFKGAESSTRRDVTGKLKFTNKRTAAYWALRDALDPGQPGGSPIALPDDPALVADLTAPVFEVTPNGIRLEPKEKVMEKIGRSPDRGDAAVMCWFEGPRHATNALEWIEQGMANKRTYQPKVVLGGRQPMSARRYQ